MRGLLIVNPSATTTTPRARDVLINALAHQFEVEAITTDHRGHARELGRQARRDKLDCVIAFGGDGTANEVVNGLLADGTGPDVPAFGVVPGGSANVFSRALGFPKDPIEATGEMIASLRTRSLRTIGLGQGNGRWFLCNAGLGLDAEIIAAIEEQRANGKVATPTRYLITTLRQFFTDTDRKKSSLVILEPGQERVPGVFIAIIQNASPWTYLGGLPVNPSPDASFDDGLDLWAVRSMSVASGLINARRIVMASKPTSTRTVHMLHDRGEFSVACRQPTALQIDGEGMGLVDDVHFTSHPRALRVFVPEGSSSLE